MANPPVCRIMDFGKFKFDEAQRAKESRRKAVHVGIKEMKYRPKIRAGRLRHQDPAGGQVPGGRPQGQAHDHVPGPGGLPSRARQADPGPGGPSLGDAAKVEFEPRLDGRNMVMVLAPDKRARQSAAARATRQAAEGGGAEAPATPATSEIPANVA